MGGGGGELTYMNQKRPHPVSRVVTREFATDVTMKIVQKKPKKYPPTETNNEEAHKI